MANKKKKLTTKQQRFVDFYDGNATEAAVKAGYKGTRATVAQVGDQNLKKVEIIKALRKREEKRKAPLIANREERQAFWTKVFRGEETQDVVIGTGDDARVVKVSPKISDRLKASELLGRSEADFIDKHKWFGKDGKDLFSGIKIELVKPDDTTKQQQATES